MIPTAAAVVAYALASTCGLLCKMDYMFAEALAADTAHPLNTAFYRASRGEMSPDAAKAAGALVASYLLDDQISVFVVVNFFVSMYALSAVITKEMFLGRLSMIEAGKLSERVLKFVMLKLVFMAAVSGPELPEIAMWVTWFAVVGYLKIFIGLARDRCEALMSSPSATVGAHIRTLTLLLLVFGNDVMWIAAFISHTVAAPGGHILLWLFDATVAALEASAILVKYGVHLAERCQEAHKWEGKGSFLYHMEMAMDVAVNSLTLAHYSHIWWLHGLTFRLVDAILFLDVRSLFFSLCSLIRRYVHYRAASHNLKHRYPDACKTQLHDDNDCAICKESMQAAKVLPCGHLFHLRCLTAWLQQSGSDNFTCPLCRTPLFSASADKAEGGLLSRQIPIVPNLHLQTPDAVDTGSAGEPPTFSGSFVAQALASAAHSMSHGSTLFSGQLNTEANAPDSLSSTSAGLRTPGQESPSLFRRMPHLGPDQRQYLHDHILQAYSGPFEGNDRLPEGRDRLAEGHDRLAERRSGFLENRDAHALGDAGSLEITGDDVMSAFYAQGGFWGLMAGRGIPTRAPQLPISQQSLGSSSQDVSAADVAAVQEALPHLSRDLIVAELRCTPNINLAVDNLMSCS